MIFLESWPPNVVTIYFHQTQMMCDPHLGLFLGLRILQSRTVRFEKFYNMKNNFLIYHNMRRDDFLAGIMASQRCIFINFEMMCEPQ